MGKLTETLRKLGAIKNEAQEFVPCISKIGAFVLEDFISKLRDGSALGTAKATLAGIIADGVLDKADKAEDNKTAITILIEELARVYEAAKAKPDDFPFVSEEALIFVRSLVNEYSPDRLGTDREKDAKDKETKEEPKEKPVGDKETPGLTNVDKK